MNTVNNLLEKIEKAKKLEFGAIFSQSIELYKKTWSQGLVMFLITIGLMIPFYVLMYLPLISMGFFNTEAFDFGVDFDYVMLIPFYLMIFVFVFFAIIIGFGLKAAFYRICKIKDFDEATSDDYFYFFRKPYLSKTIKLSVTVFGISILALLLCFLPIIYAIVPLALINVIYAFNPDLSVSNIVKIGFKLGNRKWLITFGLIIVAGFLAEIIGLLLCCIGVFVTASFAYIPSYFVYKETIGFNEKNPIEEIGVIEE